MKKTTQKFIWLFMILSIASGGVFLFLPDTTFGENFYADSDVPIILPRSTWDNTPSLNALMTWLPQNTEFPSDWQPVERIIVHDTGCDITNSTCNNNQNPVSTIQGIYRYHSVTRGWGDIGYNYLIDQQGRIYEGRYGGNGSRGAHVYVDRTKDNLNYGTIGIAILGNYAGMAPSQAALDSLTRLTAWLCVVNNLDPLGQKSSFIWRTDTKSFSTLFSGPTIAGHKDVEPGNPDPAKVNFIKLRQDAGVLVDKFKNYIYQVSGSDKIYQLQNGSRKVFANLADFTAQGLSYGKIINISKSQMDIFSATRFLKYPDGSLLQINGDPAVYLIDNGKKRNFSVSAKEFVKLGFDFKNVKKVTADELINYPDGVEIKYGPDKALLSDGVKVFYIESGKKRWITSGNLLTILGFKWPQIKNAPQDLAYYLEGGAMTYPDGALLRAKDAETVYLVKDGQKREFVSAQSFLKLGYKWNKVLAVDPIEVALYPAGDIMSYADGTLVRAEILPTVFLIDKGKAKPFLSNEVFNNLKYKATQVLIVSSGELSYYSQGEPVKYPEGRLLRPKNENTVYLISGGQAQAVDAATFKKNKYKWSQVLIVSQEDFNNLYRPAPAKAAPTSTSLPLPSPSLSPTPTPTPSASPSSSPSSSPVAFVVPKIRIGLFEVTSPNVTLTANTAFDILNKSGQVLATKNAEENFVYTIGNIATAFVKIMPQSADGIVQIVSYEDHPAWKPTLNYNKFRGSVEIVYSVKSNKVWAVNELNLEDYLKGLAETVQGDPSEYLKTMTVAARTYAYYYILKGGKRGADEVYYLLNTTSDQLYKGYSREILASDVVSAVNATKGEIAAYNGQPIVAAYSSGATELITNGSKSACAVWGSNYCQSGFEYLLGGVKDPAGTQYTQSTCGGANHCVGLSGAGARQFVKTSAKNYQEILKYYYLGTSIKKIY